MRALAIALAMFWVSIPEIICLVPMEKPKADAECHMHQSSGPEQVEMKASRCCAELVRIGAALTSRFHRDEVPESELPAMPFVSEIGSPTDLSSVSVLTRDIHSPPSNLGASSLILRI
jgi:hypothetical protein